MDAPSKMTTRTVLRSNGRAYRVLLSQPPHYRKGRDADPVIDTVALDAVRALQSCDTDRAEHYRSKGVRAITT